MAGTIVADTLQNGAGNSTSMDNAINGSAKAWANFDSSSGSSVSIRASYNVSSITYVSTGIYTINFTNAFADTNYSVVCGGRLQNGTTNAGFVAAVSMTNSTTGGMNTTSVRITTVNSAATESNSPYIGVAIFR